MTLDNFCPHHRKQIQAVIDEGNAAGLKLKIVSVLRTPSEQAIKVQQGVSWTQNSLHLAQPQCCGLSHAVDLAPAACMTKPLWDPASPLWLVLKKIVMRHGFKSGVYKLVTLKDGSKRVTNVDPGHCEVIDAPPPARVA